MSSWNSCGTGWREIAVLLIDVVNDTAKPVQMRAVVSGLTACIADLRLTSSAWPCMEWEGFNILAGTVYAGRIQDLGVSWSHYTFYDCRYELLYDIIFMI